ncbi:PIN domain-containing protein [Enterovirga aerilata]|uniref:Ribonuclease VapC n=1 Tax=Enterovirga aerilata TaxID=2730920 RepID=A0A849HTM1_9HYPH|nr:PIN domain-containing protein [Enterovirga sp. DB1703]NNM70846.1 PIN domain-containing protein [Enterovirga sp. DB1703]
MKKNDCFLDTNILLYAFTEGDPRSEPARDLLLGGGTFSVQVANEFADVSRRKLGWTWNDIAAALDSIRRCLGTPLPLDHETHRAALDLSSRYGFRFYDSLIIASAKLIGCRTLVTEDLQHGQTVDGVEIRNPFLPA